MFESKQNSEKPFISILKALCFKARRPQARGKHRLLGLGGTFGSGEIKHCDTWEIGNDLPPAISSPRDFGSMARRRRAEASVNLQVERSGVSRNAFGNR